MGAYSRGGRLFKGGAYLRGALVRGITVHWVILLLSFDLLSYTNIEASLLIHTMLWSLWLNNF